MKQVLQVGNEVLNYDKLTYAGNLSSLSILEDHPHYKFVQGDICNRDRLKAHLISYMPDTIVHFAAESHVDRSIDGPFEFIQTNIVGTAVLLEEALYYYNSLQGSKKNIFRFLCFKKIFPVSFFIS